MADEPWQPANDTERAMLRAAQADDRAEFFRIPTRPEFYLPRLRDDTDLHQPAVLHHRSIRIGVALPAVRRYGAG